MTETEPQHRTGFTNVERTAQELGDRSAGFFAKLGLSRLAAGILMILVGVLVLVRPALMVWTMGIGVIILGILLLATPQER